MGQEAVVRMSTLPPIAIPPRLRELAATFPTVAAALKREKLQTIDDLNVARLTASHGEELAIVLLLNVYSTVGPDDPHEWDWPVFNLMDAISTWDAAHRKAFAAWALEPWWC